MRKALLFILLGLSTMVFANENETLSFIREFKNIPVYPDDTVTLSKMAEVDVIHSDTFLCDVRHPQYLKMDILESEYGPKFGYYSYKLKIYYHCVS